jgi:hypothetical protein
MACYATLTLNAQPFSDADRQMVRSIFEQSLENGHTYENLEYLCLKIGPRLSGSEGADKAVAWTKELMESYGFDRVSLQ